jgi:glycosyltransferase involved in cell wall biosynthesis
LNIRHRVRLVTRTVSGADKEHVFAAARVLVLPSYSESFGNTVVEALQRGIPAIVTPEVGAAEAVTQSGGGLVVDGAAVPLGTAIASLVEDPARAAATPAAVTCSGITAGKPSPHRWKPCTKNYKRRSS